MSQKKHWILILCFSFLTFGLRAGSPYIELSSPEGKTLVAELTPLADHSGLSRFKLSDHYNIKEGRYPKGENGVYLIQFNLKRDREAFLSQGLKRILTSVSLLQKEFLKDKQADTLLLRSLSSLTDAAGLMTARKLRKQASGAITKHEIDFYGLPMKYVISRLYFDEPAQGFMVLKREESGALHMRGITWFCPFSTWARDFQWSPSADEVCNKFLDSLFPIPNKNDGSTTYPELAELSILCSSGGCGSGLLHLVKVHALRSPLYRGIITDAKETIMSFYAASGFAPVNATAISNVGKGKNKVHKRTAYYHWESPETSVQGLSQAHLYLWKTPRLTFTLSSVARDETVTNPKKRIKKTKRSS